MESYHGAKLRTSDTAQASIFKDTTNFILSTCEKNQRIVEELNSRVKL